MSANKETELKRKNEVNKLISKSDTSKLGYQKVAAEDAV